MKRKGKQKYEKDNGQKGRITEKRKVKKRVTEKRTEETGDRNKILTMEKMKEKEGTKRKEKQKYEKGNEQKGRITGKKKC